MHSVADELRAEEREALLALSPSERVALALALGERDLETFRLAQRPALNRDEAIQRLDRRRQASRRASACVESLIG
jgi:hypothetical protein